MSEDRPLRIAVAFAREVARSPGARLCDACVELLGVTGAGITIMGGGKAGPVCVSSTRMAELEDVQFTSGEGPSQDAFHSGRSVHAPRLDTAASQRWLGFVGAAQAAGIRSVFAYPLAVKGAKVGVLTLYGELEGDLTDDQHEDSTAVAEVLTETVLAMQGAAAPGELADGLGEAVAYHAEIYQASGMVSVQLGIPSSDALLRMRAHAFADDRPLLAVAADIVGRRLRLSDDHNSGEEST